VDALGQDAEESKASVAASAMPDGPHRKRRRDLAGPDEAGDQRQDALAVQAAVERGEFVLFAAQTDHRGR
jgi:hypothetical protein